MTVQVATKAGVLNLPEWYDAGEYWIKSNPNTPFGEPQALLVQMGPFLIPGIWKGCWNACILRTGESVQCYKYLMHMQLAA